MSIDFSNFLSIQKDYLYDLSALAQSGTPIGSNMNNLQQNLISQHTALTNANQRADQVLVNQQEIAKILNDEQQRIQEKKVLLTRN